MKFVRNLQRHALPDYCDYSSAASAVAGKDILLLIYDDNDELLAIAGQRSLTLNRSADTVEVSSKDTEGGWKSSIAGMKEWSIETDGLYVASDTSMKKLSNAFRDRDITENYIVSKDILIRRNHFFPINSTRDIKRRCVSGIPCNC